MNFEIYNVEESQLGSDIIKDLGELIKGINNGAEIKFNKKVDPNTKGELLSVIVIGICTSITGNVICDLLKTVINRHMPRKDFNKRLHMKIKEPDREIEITLEEILKK